MERYNMLRLVLLFAVFLQGDLKADDSGYLWWEGENPVETNFPKSSYFSANTFPEKRHLLSGSEWLTNVDRHPDAFARYSIRVRKDGEYSFWCRKFWLHGPFRWRFDKMKWRDCGRNVGLADSLEIRKHLCANWVFLGKVKLKKGKRIFELRLTEDEGAACFDCFVLTDSFFEPRGALKPDEHSEKSNDGFFPWSPGIDRFEDSSLLDLSSLNEDLAGENGYVQTSGESFVLGDGEEVRFWAVNAGPGISALDSDSLSYLAKRLAKLGVNMVRLHGAIYSKNDPKIDLTKLDNLHRFIALLKLEGIYVKLSFYFPLWFDLDQGARSFMVLFFDKQMQTIYRNWALTLMQTENPYTGFPIAKDPAVAIVEIVNEDSLFFWTFNPEKGLPAIRRKALETIYGQWLINRYGSLKKTVGAWGCKPEVKDSIDEGRMQLFSAWSMTTAGVAAQPAKKKRISDQVRFLTLLMKKFYTDTIDFYRNECGYKGLVSCGNWKVADNRMLDALERYCYTTGDLIDYHGYFDLNHSSKDGTHSYSVRKGHTFKSVSALKNPCRNPLPSIHIEGYPSITSEIGWPNPNMYRGEFPFLVAAYGALAGLDGIFSFAINSAGWNRSMHKFALNSPVIMGSFPACALIFRRGDVKAAACIARRSLDIEDLFNLEGADSFSFQALDQIRKNDLIKSEGEIDQAALSFYVGKLSRNFSGKKGGDLKKNISKQIDSRNKCIKSITGELVWDFDKGAATIDTPTAQGAAGFLGKMGRIKLANASIDFKNGYGTIMVVSLDGEPISSSKKILIQAMTIY